MSLVYIIRVDSRDFATYVAEILLSVLLKFPFYVGVNLRQWRGR
jgi:hypothetical protein